MSNRGPAERPVYLDYHATTPVDPRVADVVVHYMITAFGNASSKDHAFGDEAEETVAAAREHVARLVGAPPRSVIFTSGATESANLAIAGFARARADVSRPIRIALSETEHSAVLDTCRMLVQDGAAELTMLAVDNLGRVDLQAIETACRTGADLLCVMAANNEVGTINPVQQIGALARKYAVALFTDATQAVGRIPIRVSDWGITLLAFSAHKLYGPKGCGCLIVSPDTALRPIIHGGGHQRGLRSGTLNVPAIAGLGEACRLRSAEMYDDEPIIARRRDSLQAYLSDRIPGLVVNGDTSNRLAGNLHISVPDVPNGAIVARLRNRVALSTGAACSSGIEAPSHVLRAMRLPEPVLNGALRISLGKFTTDHDIVVAGESIVAAVDDVRRVLGVRGQRDVQ